MASSQDQTGPRGPIAVEIPAKTAVLLVELATDLGLARPDEVIGQALGLLHMLRQAKRRGDRIAVVGADGRTTDLAL